MPLEPGQLFHDMHDAEQSRIEYVYAESVERDKLHLERLTISVLGTG